MSIDPRWYWHGMKQILLGALLLFHVLIRNCTAACHCRGTASHRCCAIIAAHSRRAKPASAAVRLVELRNLLDVRDCDALQDQLRNAIAAFDSEFCVTMVEEDHADVAAVIFVCTVRNEEVAPCAAVAAGLSLLWSFPLAN